MQPIDALDFANPLENEIYEEMDPLLERIDDQQRQLREQNKASLCGETMRRDFSSNVSHEMKTLLQSDLCMLSSLSCAMVDAPTTPEVRGAHLRRGAIDASAD